MRELSAKEVWQAALGELQLQVNRANFETWLKGTVGISQSGDVFVVGVPTAFAAEYLEKRLGTLIHKTLASIVGRVAEVQFVPNRDDVAPLLTSSPSRRAADRDSGATRQASLPRPNLNPKYTFATFVVGSSNRLAYAAALGAAERPGQAYNPLFIYGSSGLGKTHLLHAIGNTALAAGHSVLYVSAEQFTNEFIAAIRERRTEEFRLKYRSSDLLLVDDIQFIAGKEQTQEGFFHTFNDMHNAGRQIAVTSDRPPGSLRLLEERLRSRFEGGLLADIQPPDLETRLAILQARAIEHGLSVPPETLMLVARNFKSNVRELDGALNRLVAFAQLSGTAPTPELATQVLAELGNGAGQSRIVATEQVVATVARYFRLAPDQLRGKSRIKHIALARQVVMYLLHEECSQPFAAIGRELGGRDHSTVLYGYNKIASGIVADASLRRLVLEIREALHNQP